MIQLHPAAPPKPPLQQRCNGCGVCCATEPCPVGIVFSLRLRGACSALTWAPDAARYHCGLMAQPAAYLPRGLRWASRLLARFAARAVSAGSGCDCTLDAQHAAT